MSTATLQTHCKLHYLDELFNFSFIQAAFISQYKH